MLHLEFKLRFSLIALFLIALLLLAPSSFYAQSAERPIRVAARICQPFVMNNAGEFSGLSIFLYYAFALPDHSPYVEKFNQALLSVRESPVWRKELVKYFGE